MDKSEETNSGPILGIIIILAILVIGGIFIFGSRIDTLPVNDQVIDEQINELSEQGTSTELSEIEGDALDTDLSGLEAALDEIESELP